MRCGRLLVISLKTRKSHCCYLVLYSSLQLILTCLGLPLF